MAETRPRDLTPAEMEGLQASSQTGTGADTAPLAVPPGTEVPVHLIDPAADHAAAAGVPTQTPPAAASA
ncbi:MAG: hypothetical protein JSR90_02460 [Proteobacteria bacterium]|nr:hypothetical protein [Pseudomonadota bacterium]